MSKYELFKKLLEIMEGLGNVTDADMNTYRDTMQILCESEDQEITIEVSIREKGES